jgi:tetratricopeptide (TPR) repeat protein
VKGGTRRPEASFLFIVMLCAGGGAAASAGEDTAPTRVAVTHFQDRTESDEYLWLRESLADQFRALLVAGGMEVIAYESLDAIGQEQAIGDAGLPTAQPGRDTALAAPEIAITGDYTVDQARIRVTVTASRIEPAELLAKVAADGELKSVGDLLRQLVPDLLRGLRSPLSPEALERVRTVPLPSYEFERWFYEGNIYFTTGMYPEAWYCFAQSVKAQPDGFDARLMKARALREMGMYDHAAVELAPACELLDIRSDFEPSAGRDWEGVDVRERVSWMAWTWLERQFRDREIWQTLEASLGDPYADGSALSTPVTDAVVALHKDFRQAWSGWYKFTDEDTHADVDLFEALLPHVNHLRRCEKFARYWALKGRPEQAQATLDKAREAWQGIRRILGPERVAGAEGTAVEKEFDKLQSFLEHPCRPSPQEAFAYKPRAKPRYAQYHKTLTDPLPDGQTWSELKYCEWAKEFTPTQMLRSHDGAHLGVGFADLSPPHAKWPVTRLAYIRSADGQTWSDPILFPPPINVPSYRSGYPILLARSDETYVLGWISEREGSDQWVYVSRSPDLVHWSGAVRTPAVGQFDLAESPDGRVMIASHNTRITDSYDLVYWSVPRLAVSAFGLQMIPDDINFNMLGSLRRAPRLIVTDDNRIHLLAVVQPGAEPDPNRELFLHAVSDDGTHWSTSLSRQVKQNASEDSPAYYWRPISAAPVKGGGLALLMKDFRAPTPPPSGEHEAEKRLVYDVAFTADGRSWKRAVAVFGDFERFKDHEPWWGALRQTADGRVVITLSAEGFGGSSSPHQEVCVADALLRGASENLPNADPQLFGTAWSPLPEERKRCIVFDTHVGDSDLDHIANSLGVLIQIDLRLLQGLQPFMAMELHSGIEIDETDLAKKCRAPRIRWADYVVQIDVARHEHDFRARGRVIDTGAAKVVYDRTITCDNQSLPEAQKTFSRDFKELFHADFREQGGATLFEEKLATDPRSFVWLSKVALFRPGGTYPGYELFDWAQQVPEAPLLPYFSHLLTDNPSHMDLRRLLGRKMTPQRRRRDHWDIVPMNPSKIGITFISSVDAVEREDALRSTPTCLPMRMTVIEGWLQEGVFQRALPHVAFLEQEYADSPEAMAECARAYEFMGDFEKARDTWQRFLATWPDDERPWPYWYGDRWDEVGQLWAPARARLAMANVRLGSFAESIPVLREWYESSDAPLDESADRMLALTFCVFALLESGEAQRVIDFGWPVIHAPHRGPDGIYRFPATIHYIHALESVGQKEKARTYLGYLLNEGYWYEEYCRAFACPPNAALREELVRMQLHRPLMGG